MWQSHRKAPWVVLVLSILSAVNMLLPKRIGNNYIDHVHKNGVNQLAASRKNESTASSVSSVVTSTTATTSSTCPQNFAPVQDRILPESETTVNRRIPKVIHFFAKSKCVPIHIYENVQQWLDRLPDYSIILHTYDDIKTHLLKPREDISFISKAFQCAFVHEAILDLARFVYLLDFGGISFDLEYAPTNGFVNGTSMFDHDDIYAVIEDEEKYPIPRFYASAKGYQATYLSLVFAVSKQFTQHSFTSYFNNTNHYSDTRKESYNYIYSRHEFKNKVKRDYSMDLKGLDEQKPFLRVRQKINKGSGKWGSIGVVDEDLLTGGNFLLPLNMTTEDMQSIQLSDENVNLNRCVDFTNDPFHVDEEALLEITGEDKVATKNHLNGSCPEGLIYQHNTFLPGSINIAGRKIPKVVHMTAKDNCFTKAFSENTDLWRHPGHSFFLHDDVAVERLFNKYEWTEFPLLKETMPCLSSGAMKADYWRYLLMWKFGGIYTDVDNTPGTEWKDASVIEDYMDALFEVESGGFPSQYFFAIPPRHPVSYFMLHVSINNLLFNLKPISFAKIPYIITGPRACKNGVILSIGGNGYPQKGNYTGVFNRNITMIGKPGGRNHLRPLIRRGAVRRDNQEDEDKMGMPHYMTKDMTKKTGLPDHRCTYQFVLDYEDSLAT